MKMYIYAAIVLSIIYLIVGLIISVKKWKWPHNVYFKMSKFIFRKPYLYALEKDYECPYPVDAVDCDHEWAKVVDGVLTVKAGYAWNGCSPKNNILDLKITGTPEGIIDYRTGKPKTYFASMCHDARYQYRIGSKDNADMIFLKMMQEIGFAPAKAYYWAVNKFGSKAWNG